MFVLGGGGSFIIFLSSSFSSNPFFTVVSNMIINHVSVPVFPLIMSTDSCICLVVHCKVLPNSAHGQNYLRPHTSFKITILPSLHTPDAIPYPVSLPLMHSLCGWFSISCELLFCFVVVFNVMWLMFLCIM